MKQRVFRGISRRVKSTLDGLEYSFKASSWCSKLFFVFLLNRPSTISDNTFHFLIPPPGNGNIGDQSMVESFINYVGSDCVLIVEDQIRFKQQNSILPEPKFIEIPHIIHGNLFQNIFALITILKISNKMKSFSIIGADIMDGVYGLRVSINRLFLLRVINSLKINSRITGFSWSPNANPLATKLMRIISNETKLCVRDPKSARRLESHQISAISEVADIAFADESIDNSPFIELWVSSSTKPIVTVNISGLGVRDGDKYLEHIQQYKQIVECLHAKGFRILVLPHVFRVEDGDIEPSGDLFRSSCGADDLLITEPISPAQERQLFRATSFVITGRMHIAILALSVGRPVIALETMGKVKGLFEMFDLEKYCLDRNVEFANEVIHAIELLEKEYLSVCKLIQDKIPEIRQRSLLNFADLDLI
jgi:colanic acid/amylovoran biosynthesis protein